jgi:hypothetical protein
MRKLARLIGVLGIVFGVDSHARAESVAANRLSISSASVTEGNSGKTPFSVQVSYYGYNYNSQSVSVAIHAYPGTANKNDYEFESILVTLASGESKTVSGYILGDLDPEANEMFTLRGTLTADGGTYGYFYSSDGVITISDDDMARASRLYVDDATVLEGNSGSSTVDVRVRLEPAATSTVTVEYSLSPIPGAPNVPINGILTFAPGEVLKTVPVMILGNTTWEGDHTVHFNLASPTAAMLGRASGTITIKEDDEPVRVFLADQEFIEGSDGPQTVTLTVQMDKPVTNTPKLIVRVESAGATLGEDFQYPAKTHYPTPGSTQLSFDFVIVGDTHPECDEGFLIHYQGLYMGDETLKVAKILIRDDDGGLPSCPDPFAPKVIEAHDGGPPVDAEETTVDTQPPKDTMGVPPLLDSSTPDAIIPSSPDGGIVPGTSDADSVSGIKNSKLNSSGCTLNNRAGISGMVVLAVALGLALAIRRRRST